MFSTHIVNVFVPLGNAQSAQSIIAGISSHCVDPEKTGELLIRVFEYRDINKVLAITNNVDTVLTYPEVFPLGRHYDQAEYSELIKQTCKGARGIVVDYSLPKDFEFIKDTLHITHSNPQFDRRINVNLSWYFGYSTTTSKPVDPLIAKHVGSRIVAFVSAQPAVAQPHAEPVPTPVKSEPPVENEPVPVPTPVENEPVPVPTHDHAIAQGDDVVPTESPKTTACQCCNHVAV